MSGLVLNTTIILGVIENDLLGRGGALSETLNLSTKKNVILTFLFGAFALVTLNLVKRDDISHNYRDKE